jgi:hypothetical protein
MTLATTFGHQFNNLGAMMNKLADITLAVFIGVSLAWVLVYGWAL